MNLRRALELAVLAPFMVACRTMTPIASGETTQTPRTQIDTTLRAHRGKPQRYGNSFSFKDGRLVADPIEDVGGLDARRAGLGLPTMSEYVRQLGEMYKTPVEWPPKPPE